MKVIRHCKETVFKRDFSTHTSRLADRLWRTPGDDLAVSQLTNLWRSTLLKKGCRTLMQSGTYPDPLLSLSLFHSSLVHFQESMAFSNRSYSPLVEFAFVIIISK